MKLKLKSIQALKEFCLKSKAKNQATMEMTTYNANIVKMKAL